MKKIRAAEDNTEEWFQLVRETENDRYIIQNAECRISREPFNIDLWKLYIQFLLTKNGKVWCKGIWKV